MLPGCCDGWAAAAGAACLSHVTALTHSERPINAARSRQSGPANLRTARSSRSCFLFSFSLSSLVIFFFLLALDGRHIVRHGSINVIAVRELGLPLRFSFPFLQNGRPCEVLFLFIHFAREVRGFSAAGLRRRRERGSLCVCACADARNCARRRPPKFLLVDDSPVMGCEAAAAAAAVALGLACCCPVPEKSLVPPPSSWCDRAGIVNVVGAAAVRTGSAAIGVCM